MYHVGFCGGIYFLIPQGKLVESCTTESGINTHIFPTNIHLYSMHEEISCKSNKKQKTISDFSLVHPTKTFVKSLADLKVKKEKKKSCDHNRVPN